MSESCILVTGAGGYLGSRLVPLLLERGWRVRAIDRFFFGTEALEAHPHLQTIREDTRRLDEAHLEGVDAVIDLVAVSNETSGRQFARATRQINCDSRVRTAGLAKAAGASFYLLPSTCSVYGAQERDAICTEESPIRPQTEYARATRDAEIQTLALADERFTVTVLRQATVFGPSPRLRLDLAINFMIHRAFHTGTLPVVRDGSQWRPFVHIDDAVAAQLFMLEQADRDAIHGQIYNVGANDLNHTALGLAEHLTGLIPREVELDWIGDPDSRSYHIRCDKIEALGWKAQRGIADGVAELWKLCETGEIDDAPRSHTLRWYRDLDRWHKIIREIEMYGGILEIDQNGDSDGLDDTSR